MFIACIDICVCIYIYIYTHICIYMCIYKTHKKERNLAICVTTWIDLECIM